MDGANGEYCPRAGLNNDAQMAVLVAVGDGCALVVVSRAKRAREVYFGESALLPVPCYSLYLFRFTFHELPRLFKFISYSFP